MARKGVHKDFHAALSVALHHIRDEYGAAATESFLRQNARNVFKPLIAAAREAGLPAIEKHFRDIFMLEEAEFGLYYDADDVLVLKVRTCPAICHMKKHNYMIADNFCESTRITNEEICAAAGLVCSVEYDQNRGCCVQKFWEDRS